MKIVILCPSPLGSDNEASAFIAMYAKRMDWSVEFKTPKIKLSASTPPDMVKKKQGDVLVEEIAKMPQALVIALDENGKNINSQDLSKLIESAQLDHAGQVCFIIGGAYGLAPEVLQTARHKISFGTMTWPHRLVGVMLMEQLYRSQQIIKGHPYHKE